MSEREQFWRFDLTPPQITVVICYPRWRSSIVTFELSCVGLEDNVFVVVSASTLSSTASERLSELTCTCM